MHLCHACGVPTSPVPAGPEPAEDTQRPVMPASIRVAAITMGVLAALLLVDGGLTWYAYRTVIARLVDAGSVSRAEAEQTVTTLLVIHLLLGLVLALAAWFLPRRQAWARWVGLAASALLALMTLFSMLAAGGSTVSALLLFVLSAAAVTSLIARSSGTWVPRLRSRA
jgi:hypothetical protein